MDIRKLCTTLLLSALSGCAVKPIDENGAVIRDSAPCNEINAQSEENQNTLCDALKLADGYRRGYLRRTDVIGSTREIGGLLTIGAATTALYYGLEAREKFRDRVHRLGSLSAGAYATGLWVLPPSKEEIYLEGAHAMTCLALVTLSQLPTTEHLNQLKAAEQSLSNDLKAFRDKIRNSLPDQQAQYRPDVLYAESVQDRALRTLAMAETTGAVLRQKVQAVDIKVRQLLASHAPDLQSLRTIIGSLSTTATDFGAQRLAKPTPAAKRLAIAEAAGATADNQSTVPSSETSLELEKAASQLGEAVERTEMLLNQILAKSMDVERVDTCFPNYTARFAVVPAQKVVSIEAGKRYYFEIQDRSGFPRATVVGEQTESLKLHPIEIGANPDHYRLQVEGLRATTGIGGPTLIISSSSGAQQQEFGITVKKAAAQSAGAPQTEPNSKTERKDRARSPLEPRTDYEVALFDRQDRGEKILAVQCLVKDAYVPGLFAPDCKMGRNTRNAILRHSGGVSDAITPELIQQAEAALPPGLRCHLPIEQRCLKEVGGDTP